MRDAINAANIGVSATIINDGTSNRLVLTAKDTGAASSIKITASDDDGAQPGRRRIVPACLRPDGGCRFRQESDRSAGCAGRQASRSMGSPSARGSNTVTDAIEGVTLNLLKSNAGSPTTLAVARDSAGIKASVETFVKSYNNINQTLADLSSYNAAAKKGGVLQGDSAALSIQVAHSRHAIGRGRGGAARRH